MYHRARLTNGLRIVGEVMPNVNSVAIGLWVGAGSRDEKKGMEGVSHLIEHMLFKGTTRRSAREIAEAIDAVGGQLNAFTTREYTCFYVKILDRHMALGLELLAEMFCSSLFDPVELEKEKGVVLEEIKSYEDAPDELVYDLLAAAWWPDHPLGRPILGTPSSVARLTREDALAYMAEHYRPEETVLAVAGRFVFEEVVRLAEQNLASLSPSPRAVQRERPVPFPGRLVKTKDTEQVHLCLGGRGVERRNPEKFAFLVLDSILGGSVSSRLFQRLREDRGLVYAIGSTHTAFRDAGLLTVYAGTDPRNVEEVIRLILEEMRRLATEPVDEAELARAKEQIRGNFLLGLESTSARMSRLAKAELFYERLLTPEEVLALIDAVTAEDVQRVARFAFEGPLPAAAVAPARLKLDLERLLGEGVVV
ncbi:MAG: M16 family metallopeptidase [Bacillota bacterium]